MNSVAHTPHVMPFLSDRLIIFEKTPVLLRLIYLSVAVFAGFLLQAQPAQEYLFTHMSIRNGLLASETTSLQQDPDGYIWIATLNGLQRYDGHRFLNFHHDDHNPLTIPDDKVYKILLDKDGRLWLLCTDNKIGYFNTKDFTFHPVNVDADEQWKKSQAFFLKDNAGNAMICFLLLTIVTYDETTNEFTARKTPFIYPKTWKPVWFSQDHIHNDYWIGCDSGLAKYNPSTKTLSYRDHNVDKDPVIQHLEKFHFISQPYFDHSGRFWMISWPPKSAGMKFLSYDLSTGKIKDWAPDLLFTLHSVYYEIHSIKEMEDGSIWISGINMFASLDKNQDDFEMVANDLPGEYSIRYDHVWELLEDREKNLWVGSNSGLYRFNPTAQLFRKVKNRRIYKDSVHSPDVTDFLQTKSGDILVSTWGSGLFSYNSRLRPIQTNYMDQSLRTVELMVWCMHQRSNGDIWRGNQDGNIFVWHASSNSTQRILRPEAEGSTIRQIAEDRNGNLWLGTNNGLLIKWDASNNQFKQIHRLNSTILRLYADKQGDIWTCTSGNGVYKINPDNDSIAASYFSSGPVGKKMMTSGATDIIQYNDSLFMVASGGLNILNVRNDSISYYSTNNGLPSNTVTNVIKDKKGLLWITTERGLCSLDYENNMLVIYTEEDGVHTNSFDVASTCLLNDGRILIGASHDFIVFNPSDLMKPETSPPDVFITGFSLMNKPLLMDSLIKLNSVELSQEQSSITIDFSTLTYLTRFGIRYMLEGMDKDWVKGNGDINQAVYNYLPAGNYTFKIKASNRGSEFSKKITELKIKVKPPFWKTWWFVGLLAFAAVGIIFWIDKFRIAHIRNTERVRTRIATSLTKDMSSTLSNINMLSEMAKHKAGTDIDRTKDYIGQISDSSHRMMEVMDDMVWSISPENDEMQSMLVRMKKYANAIEIQYNVEINFNIDEKVGRLQLDMDRRHELFLIFKEALLNIGKHSKSKYAAVDLEYEKQKLILKIVDDGRGFDTGDVVFGRGLNEMRKRADQLKAKLDIIAEVNTGTVVQLEMVL